MELEKQVTSLEPSKRLAELGVKQESLFYWQELELHEWEKGQNVETHCISYSGDEPCLREDISAFTVAELGELLPELSSLLKIETGWRSCCTYSEGMQGYHHKFEAETEADCRAQMLIYLLENNLISLPA